MEYFDVAGEDWAEHIRVEILEQRSLTQGRQQSRNVEVLFETLSGAAACNDCGGGSSGGRQDTGVYARKSEKRAAGDCAKKSKEESIYNYLLENPVSPLANVVHTPKWLADPALRFVRLDDKHLQRALQVLNDQLVTWTTLDFIEWYRNTNPLIDAPNGDVAGYYMTPQQSMDAAEELLHFQFEDDTDQVRDFVNDLYKLVEKRVPKRNCMEVVSPPSAGKNFFSDPVISFYVKL